MAAPIPLPGYRERKGDPIVRRRPHVLDLMGKPTMIVHCDGLVTGLSANNAEAGANYDGTIMALCYTPGQFGMMYLMSIDHARSIAASLNRLCDKQEAAAAAAAAGALQKAGAK